MKVCAICRKDLKGREDAVYSSSTGRYFCPVREWDACAKREQANHEREAA